MEATAKWYLKGLVYRTSDNETCMVVGYGNGNIYTQDFTKQGKGQVIRQSASLFLVAIQIGMFIPMNRWIINKASIDTFKIIDRLTGKVIYKGNQSETIIMDHPVAIVDGPRMKEWQERGRPSNDDPDDFFAYVECFSYFIRPADEIWTNLVVEPTVKSGQAKELYFNPFRVDNFYLRSRNNKLSKKPVGFVRYTQGFIYQTKMYVNTRVGVFKTEERTTNCSM